MAAKVESIESIRAFRTALIKFRDVLNVSLSAADSEIGRTLTWLERDAATYWAGQLKKRHDQVIQCEDAVRQKRIFKSFDGTQQSVVDEMKALQIARRRREEAEEKILAVKRSVQLLRKEADQYRGRVQGAALLVQGDLPKAIYQLDQSIRSIEQYLSIQSAGQGSPMTEAASSIANVAERRVGRDALRGRTPTSEQRRAAEPRTLAPDEMFFQPWPAGVIEDWQLHTLANLTVERRERDPDKRVVVEKDCWQAPEVYLEATEPTSEQDSGWFLGMAGEGPADPKRELQFIRVVDLVQARPDLAAILALPIGTLAGFDAGGLAALLDEQGVDLWAVAMASAAPEKVDLTQLTEAANASEENINPADNQKPGGQP